MKRLVVLLVGVVAAAAVLWLLVIWLVDTPALSARLVESASAALGRTVEIEDLDLALLPPAIHVRELRVAGERPRAAALARVPEITLGLRLWPLLSGELVLGTVVVEGASIRLPERGGAYALSGSGPGAGRDAPQTRSPLAGLGIALVAEEIRIQNATVALGDAKLSGIQATGHVSLDPNGGFRKAKFLLEGELGGQSDGVALAGPLAFEFSVPGRFRLDLSQAEFRPAEGPAKSAGTRLVLEGELDALLPPQQISEGALSVADLRIPFSAELGQGGLSLRLPGGNIDLAALGPLQAGRRASGRIRHGVLDLAARPLAEWRLSGAGEFDSAELPTHSGSVGVAGGFYFAERQVLVGPIALDFGGGPVQAQGKYDLGSGVFELESRAEAAEVAPIVAAFADQLRVDGTLHGEFALTGETQAAGFLETLDGRGRFRIDDGRVQGLSLLRSLEGSLAAIPVLLAQLQGRDLSRYEEEQFRLLSADFTISEGRLWTRNLVLDYRGARAELRGSVDLQDLSLELAGRAVLYVDADPGDPNAVRTRVIPIAGVRGTLLRPRVHIAASTLVELAAEYAAGTQVFDQLERTLGTENVDAVKGLLDRILGGASRDRERR